MLASSAVEHGGDCPKIFKQVRGNPMAKAALENAIWDLEAQIEKAPLSQLLGGTAKAHSVRRLDRHSALHGAATATRSSASWPPATSASS